MGVGSVEVSQKNPIFESYMCLAPKEPAQGDKIEIFNIY